MNGTAAFSDTRLASVPALCLAELRLLVRRPVVWVLVVGVVAFVLVPGYYGQVGNVWEIRGYPGAEGHAAYLAPVNAPFYTVRELAPTGGLLAFTLGAFAFGRDYQWGTAATRVLHAPGRTRVVAVRLGVLAAVLLGVAALAHMLVLGMAVTASLPPLDVPTGLPSVGRLLGGIGISGLVLTCWAAMGAALAVLLRSPTAALVVGAVYRLSVEETLGFLAGHADSVATVYRNLPSALANGGANAVGFLGEWVGVRGPWHDPAVALSALAAVTAIGVALIPVVTRRQQL